MIELSDSINKTGVLVPAIVRMKEDGNYEMIAGHRRKLASQLCDKENIPCIIRDLSDDEATIIMVDTNLSQRERLLPSEKAFAYKMNLVAMKRQGFRNNLTSTPVVERLSVAKLGKEYNESRETVRRYIRLTKLIPEILEMVDNDLIALRIAEEISFLSKENQQYLYEYIDRNECTPSHAQTIRLHKMGKQGSLSIKEIDNRVIEIVLTNITFITKTLTVLLMIIWIYQLNYIIIVYIFITVILHAIIGALKEKKLYLRYINMIKNIRQIDYCRRIFYNDIFAKSVKLNSNLINKMNNYYNCAIDDILIIIRKYARKLGIIDFISEVISNYLSIFLLIYLIVLVSKGQLFVSEFVLLTSLISSVSKDLMDIFVKFNEMYSNSLHMDNLNYILKDNSNDSEKDLNAFNESDNELYINDIEFAYPNDKDRVISKLNGLRFYSGQKIAFVGENGSGKSTLSYFKLI